MRNTAQLRWMAEAEAAQFREFALVQHGASEPQASILVADPGSTLLDLLEGLAPRITAGLRRRFSGKPIAPSANFAAEVIALDNARLLREHRAQIDRNPGWNRATEARLAARFDAPARCGQLRQLTALSAAQPDDGALKSHRREIVVVFCDLRGFAGFAERAEPEEVMALLRAYHAALGPIIASFGGTLGHHAGEGLMVFFNDPLPCPDPARRAIDMAMALREAAQALLQTWRRCGHELGFGIGISQGYATLGQIGVAEHMDYTAVGTVPNLAARLCGEAKDGQILISRRVAAAVEHYATLEPIGELALEGLSQVVAVHNVAQPTPRVEPAERLRPVIGPC